MTTHTDLLKLAESAERFATVALPSPSHFDDSAQRFDVEWKNARKELAETWDAEDLASIDDAVGGLSHDGGAAVVLIHGKGSKAPFIELLQDSVDHAVVHSDRLPRLATIIDGRQRSIPHVMVETDRTGADLTAFDGGDVVSTEQVEGETLHVHRSAPGGWSQRRFQQRSENIWEENGGEVAESVAAMAQSVAARLIVIAGDSRSQGLVYDALPSELADITTLVEEGSPDGIADRVVRLLSNAVAERVVEVSERVKAGMSSGQASADPGEIFDALLEGRVDTLLVNDDDLDDPVLTEDHGDFPAGTRIIDAAIVGALRTDAAIVVVPNLSVMSGPIAATMRW